MTCSRSVLALAGCLTLTWAASGLAAVTPAQKCQAAKLTTAGKDAACRASALAKVALGGVNNVGKCDAKLTAVFAKLEAKGGCATRGDAATVAARVRIPIDVIQSGLIFSSSLVDNGDGTVTDVATGLQWEQKNYDNTSVHWLANFYTWSSTGCPGHGTTPDGSAFTTFLATLNANSGGGCFAGHCDWRLPSIGELGMIIDPSAPACNTVVNGNTQGGCIDAIFGPAAFAYWSSTTDQQAANQAIVQVTIPPFTQASADNCADGVFIVGFGARAVRSVSGPNCGDPEQPCCTGSTCNNPNTACSPGGTCVACGAVGQSCCAGNVCTASGSVCVGGTCGCVPYLGACTMDADCCNVPPHFCNTTNGPGTGFCDILQ